MKSSELFRKLKKDGWYVYREAEGSHKILRHKKKKVKYCLPITEVKK